MSTLIELADPEKKEEKIMPTMIGVVEADSVTSGYARTYLSSTLHYALTTYLSRSDN